MTISTSKILYAIVILILVMIHAISFSIRSINLNKYYKITRKTLFSSSPVIASADSSTTSNSLEDSSLPSADKKEASRMKRVLSGVQPTGY